MIVEQIKDCIQEVYDELGPGHRETVYQEALCHEFRIRAIPFFTEHSVEVLYKQQKVGLHFLDFLVIADNDDTVIIELKATNNIDTPMIRGQLISYMRTLSVDYGILVNFHYTKEPIIIIEENNEQETV